jgi:signal transduction histidine kinase/CheY-like chemotaxis protein/HPt (histidine-containing phosphotransfer) domain-containing protein
MILEVSHDEEARLVALAHYQILDSPPENSFDEIVLLAAQIGQAPIALLSFVDEERQWIKAAYGFHQESIARQLSFCAQTILQDTPLIIPHVRHDEYFRRAPLDDSLRDVSFYAGVPLLTPDGCAVGTLCIMDRFPRTLAPRGRQALVMLARQAMRQLEWRRRLRAAQGGLPVPPAVAETPAPEEPELQKRLDEALAAARHKAQQFATLSHEIRTPVNGILGMAHLLARTELSKEQRDYLDLLRGSADALVTLVNDALDFAKLEAGKISLETVDFDLLGLFENTVTMFAGRAQRKGLELVSQVTPDVPLALRGDPGRLRQILNNLLSNAVKFTERGEIVAQVERLEADDARARLCFTVRDTGPGISPEFLPYLYQSYAQEAAAARRADGTGLGLAIAKQLAEMMGGVIEVASEVGQGTVFRVTLPFACRTTAANPVLPPEDLQGLRALIVDDNAVTGKILRQQTLAWGMSPVVVSSAEEAWQVLHGAAQDGPPFAVAVIDWEMPGLDGIELARRIHAEAEWAALPTILLTAFGWRGQAQAARDAGLAAYLTKPVRQAQLFECLVTVLGLRVEKEAAKPLVTRHNLRNYTPLAQNARVLLADDNLTNQQVTVHQLYKLGYTADVVGNGREALAALAQHDYDLLLLDCQMPEMDGYQTAAALRAAAGPRPYVIALTGYAGPAERAKCRAAGMDDYLSKPFSLSALQRALQRWLDPEAAPEPEEILPPEAEPDAPNDAEAEIAAAPEEEPLALLPEEPAPEEPPVVLAPAVDLSALARLISRDGTLKPSLAVELIDIFLHDAAKHQAALRAAWPAREAAALRRVSHSLKSSSASLGARRLAELCNNFNQHIAANDFAAAEPLLGQLEAELARVCDALRDERQRLAQ